MAFLNGCCKTIVFRRGKWLRGFCGRCADLPYLEEKFQPRAADESLFFNGLRCCQSERSLFENAVSNERLRRSSREDLLMNATGH